MAAGDLMVGYLLLRQAAVALTKLDGNGVSAGGPRLLRGQAGRRAVLRATVLPRAGRRAARSPRPPTTR